MLVYTYEPAHDSEPTRLPMNLLGRAIAKVPVGLHALSSSYYMQIHAKLQIHM